MILHLGKLVNEFPPTFGTRPIQEKWEKLDWNMSLLTSPETVALNRLFLATVDVSREDPLTVKSQQTPEAQTGMLWCCQPSCFLLRHLSCCQVFRVLKQSDFCIGRTPFEESSTDRKCLKASTKQLP